MNKALIFMPGWWGCFQEGPEYAKKSSSTSGPTTKRVGGGVKGKEKKLLRLPLSLRGGGLKA